MAISVRVLTRFINRNNDAIFIRKYCRFSQLLNEIPVLPCLMDTHVRKGSQSRPDMWVSLEKFKTQRAAPIFGAVLAQ